MTLKLATGRMALPIASSTLQMPAPFGAARDVSALRVLQRSARRQRVRRDRRRRRLDRRRSFPLAPRALVEHAIGDAR